MARKPRRKGATRAEFAAHVGLTPQRVGQMIAENVVPLHGDGSIDQDAGRLAYIGRLRTDAGRSDSARRVQDVRAEMLRFKLERERGEFWVADAAEAAFSEIFAMFRSELDGVPAASTRDLEQRAVIAKNLADVYERMNKRLAAMEATFRNGELPGDDEADEDETTNPGRPR